MAFAHLQICEWPWHFSRDKNEKIWHWVPKTPQLALFTHTSKSLLRLLEWWWTSTVSRRHGLGGPGAKVCLCWCPWLTWAALCILNLRSALESLSEEQWESLTLTNLYWVLSAYSYCWSGMWPSSPSVSSSETMVKKPYLVALVGELWSMQEKVEFF